MKTTKTHEDPRRPTKTLSRLVIAAALWSCGPAVPPADLEPLLAWRAEDLGAAEPEILAQVGSALDRLQGAIREGEKGPALADRLGEVAMLHQIYRRTDRALEANALAADRDPSEPRWAYYEALIRHEEGDLAGTVSALERCLATGTEALPPQVRLAETLVALGDTESAIERYAGLRASHPDSVRVRVGWAEAQLALGQGEAAREMLEPLARAQPEARRIRLALGRARRATGDLDGARALLDQLPPLSAADLRLDLRDPWVQQLAALNQGSEAAVAKARALIQQGLPEAAVASLQALVERHPDRPSFWTDLGTAREQLGNFTEAEAAFTRAIEADPEYLPALAQLGSLQQRLGHNTDAIATFDRLLALDPHRPSVLFLKAEAHRLAGDLPSAIDAFERSLEFDPDDERVLIGLAAAHFQGGDRGAAAGAVARGLAARPDSFWFRSLKLRLCAVGRACPASFEEAELLFRSRPTAFAAESLAMTFANHGDFAAAHRWQTAAIAALEASGDAADLARTRELAYREHRLDVPTFRPEEFSASRVPVSRPN